MACSNLGYQIWVIAIYLYTTSLKGISSMKMHRDLNITQRSAWYLLHRIRHCMSAEEQTLFEGPVEVDETTSAGKNTTSMPEIDCVLAEKPLARYQWLA